MPRASTPKPSHTVESAMMLLRRELARLAEIDRGEGSSAAVELERERAAEAVREREAAIRERDAEIRARVAIAESRDNLRRELERERQRPAAQTIELQLREEIAALQRRNAELRMASGQLDADAASQVGARADHDALCWRAFVDAVRVMPGALALDTCGEGAAESEANLDHPLGEIACAMLRAGSDDLGALPTAQIIASELHALVRDASAWRVLDHALADGIANESDRDAIGETMRSAVASAASNQAHAEWNRTSRRHMTPSERERMQLAPFAAWDAAELGRMLGEAAARGLTEAQQIADADAIAADNAAEAEQGKPEPRDDHAVWWRTFVAAACGSNKEDGDARRLAWAMRRARLPIGSCDDSIETVEACGLLLGEILDRLEANRVA